MRVSYLIVTLAALPALLWCTSDPAPPPLTGNTSTDAAPASDAADAAEASDGGAPSPCGELTTTWKRCPQNPLYVAGRALPDGDLELSVGDPDVMYDADEGKWKAWWSTGAARSFAQGKGAPIHIKYAESSDGVTWNVQPEPVLRSGGDPMNWDNSGLETPTVVKVPNNPPERRYVMFYAGGNDVDYPRLPNLDYLWYQIGVAYSADGKRFTRMPASESPYAGKATGFRKVEGLMLLARDAYPGKPEVVNGVVADPEVVFDGTSYWLFFSSLGTESDRSRYLTFGISRAKIDNIASPRLSPSSGNPLLFGAAQPSVIRTEAGYELYAFYDLPEDDARVPLRFNQMYGIYKHLSTDLQTFSARPQTPDFSVEDAVGSEKWGMVKTGDVVYRDGVRRFYYPAFRDRSVPSGFYAPLKLGSVSPLPDGGFDLPEAGLTIVPAVIGLHLAARR
jgi:hypothetical protein